MRTLALGLLCFSAPSILAQDAKPQNAPAQPAGQLGSPDIDSLFNRPIPEILPSWATKPADRNAALLYWTASAHVPETLATKLGAVEWDKVGDEWQMESLPKEFVDFAMECRDNELLLTTARAAELTKCDFEIPYEYGIGALLPHLGKLRQLARFVRVDARLAIAENQPDRAADRIVTMLKVSQHADNDRILISSLVGNAIMELAKEETRVFLKSGRLTEPARAKLEAAYKAIPATDPNAVKEAIGTERDVFINWADAAYLKRGDAKGFLSTVVALTASDAGADQVAPYAKMTAEQLRRELDAVRETFGKIVAVWDDPDAAVKIKSILADAEKTRHGMFMKLLLPSFSRIIDNQTKARAELKEMIASLAKPGDAK